MRLRRKITVAFFLVSALISLLLALFLYRFVERQLRAELRNRLRTIAALGARTIDGPAYGRLRDQVGELEPAAVTAIERGGGDYQRVSDQLNAIRATEPDLLRYAYILVPTADPDHPRFVVDADVLAGAPDDPELSHFGQDYDVSALPVLRQALLDCQPAMESDFTYDPDFKVHSVSGYMPVPAAPGPDGRCAGILGVDITDADMRAALGKAGSLAVKVSLAVIALALVVSIIMGTMMTRSVIALSTAVKRFADKDFAVRTQVGSSDEIGQLGTSFNTMAETIQHHSDNLEQMVQHRTSELEAEKQTSERLLLNVLPAPIAARLKLGGVIVDRFDNVTVLFADIVGFTALSARTSPEALVAMLDDLFTRFDGLADRHGLEKIKTIGDAYMVVAGVPEKSADHAIAMARMGLDMLATLADYAASNSTSAELTIRIGIHSGPVVAGVIGRNKFIYDLWGDTVNTASRMESHGLPSRVHLTEATHAALGDRFECESRGLIDVKGKGPMTTYFLVRELERVAEVAPPPPPAPPTLDELGVTVARRSLVASGSETTELVVILPRATGVDATFAREGLGRKLSKIVKKELQTGDPGFDDAVFITTDTALTTTALLVAREVRDAIAAVVALGGTVAIAGATVTLTLPGRDGDAAAVERLARALAER